MTDRLARSDSIFVRLNLFVLMAVAFLPFPQAARRRCGEHEAERVAVTVYGLTLLVVRLVGAACDSYARPEDLYVGAQDDEDDGDDAELRGVRHKSRAVIGGYLIALVVGLAVPVSAMAFYFGLAVYLVVPFREIARLLRQPAHP